MHSDIAHNGDALPLWDLPEKGVRWRPADKLTACGLGTRQSESSRVHLHSSSNPKASSISEWKAFVVHLR